MKNNLYVKRANEQKRILIKENNNIFSQRTLKNNNNINNALKNNNNKIRIKNPFIIEKIISERKNESQELIKNRNIKKNYIINKKVENTIKSNIHVIRNKKILTNEILIHKKNKNSLSKGKNIEGKINKNNLRNNDDIKNNFEKKEIEKNKNIKNIRIIKENSMSRILDKYRTVNYFISKHFLERKIKKNSHKNLYSTETSSSMVKNNMLNKTKIKKYNSVNKDKIIFYNKLLKNMNKVNSNKNSVNYIKKNIENKNLTNKKDFIPPKKKEFRNINTIKDYIKKTKNNEFTKKINSTLDNESINKENKIINDYSSKNKVILYNKLSYISRKQCKKKKLSINYTGIKKHLFSDTIDDINDIDISNKIIILIKSNWGNISKINFISFNFIDELNEKIRIYKANYDVNKPYVNRYNKGEIKKLIFYYDIKEKIKNIEIINGFDDSGIKSIIIMDKNEEIIWRGNIPKKNLISNKPYIIILNNISRFLKKRKNRKMRNISLDLERTIFSDKNTSNNFIDDSILKFKNHNIKMAIKPIKSVKNKEINKTNKTIKIINETYDRDNYENNKDFLFSENINNTIFQNKRPIVLKRIEIINSSPNKKEKEKEIKSKYQICDKIKIELISNYGHSKYIGLSGIEFFDDIESLIDVNSNIKDIKLNQIKNNRQKKMISNLFNGKNNTKDVNCMFYTRNNQASFEIEFKQQLKIKKIIIYNYNDDKYKNIGTKKISFIFYKNGKAEKTIKSIYLNKNIGEEGIEYGQILKYPFNNLFNVKKYKNLNENIKNDLFNLVYNRDYDYYCPSFPSGFIIKLLLVNNWGNNEYIGFEQIKIFNENNEEIIMSEKNEKVDCKENSNIPNIYLFPDKLTINPKINPIILTKYKIINCFKNENYINRIYIIFNNLVMISRINIKNYCKYDEISVKCIKIFIDDNLIFEGQLNKNDNEIFFSNKEMEDFYSKKDKIDSNKIIVDRYFEKEFENGTKILSIV